MIFWLVLKLEISYRVIISWRILVSFRGCFWRLHFCIWKYLSFQIFILCLKILFNVNGKATVLWHSPCWDVYELVAVNFENILLSNLQNKHKNFLGCFWWSWTLPKPITLPTTLKDWRHAYQCRWPILNNTHWLHFPTSMMRIDLKHGIVWEWIGEMIILVHILSFNPMPFCFFSLFFWHRWKLVWTKDSCLVYNIVAKRYQGW